MLTTNTALLPALVWLLPFVALMRLARRRPLDIERYPAGNTKPVTVIIPARNEAATIETLLASVTAAAYPALDIIVVDDRSTDDTAARVTTWTQRDSRISLIPGAKLPTGWLGKPWACHQGALTATGDVLVFTDADTQHHADLIDHTVGALQAENADLLTLTSHQVCITFWERLVMPQIWMLLGLRYPPARINRATRPHQVVANGQFIAVNRERYFSLGGHEAVKHEVVEDLALAQHWFRNGARIRMLHGESMLSTRMYRSLAEMTEGWSKNLHVGARQSLSGLPLLPHLATLGVMAVFVFWLVPPVLLVLGIATDAMLLAIGLSIIFWGLTLFTMKIPLPYAFGYPLGAATALWIVVRSALRGNRRIEWRGRTYDLTPGG